MAEPHNGIERICSEVNHVTYTHISLAIASHMAKPDVHGMSSAILPQGEDQ